MSPELEKCLALLEANKPLTAMLAPAFPIDFSFPQIIGRLKRSGFGHVVEVSRGAMEVNKQLVSLLKEHPQSRYITSPCPTIVRFLRAKYPHLVHFLAPIASPMVEMAKIVRATYPTSTPVFIGPCLAKKIEASQDHPELGIIVLTFTELSQMFTIKGVEDDWRDQHARFDIVGDPTRLYALSGGLAQSAGLKDLLTDEEYDVVSGNTAIAKSMQEFEKGKLRVLDILYCEGGCIAGPGAVTKAPLSTRRRKLLSYWTKGI